MADAREAPASPVLGDKLDMPCPKCAAVTVIETYRHFATRVLFCMTCEQCWTEENVEA